MSHLLKKKQATKLQPSHKSESNLDVPSIGNIINDLDKAINPRKSKKEKPKLPAEFKDKWLEALRSGKYTQVIGDLASQNDESKWEYCVLGVAGRVAGYSPTKLKCDSELPNNLRKIPDILKVDKNGKNHPIADKLIGMNDDKKMSFNKLANWIEKNL